MQVEVIQYLSSTQFHLALAEGMRRHGASAMSVSQKRPVRDMQLVNLVSVAETL